MMGDAAYERGLNADIEISRVRSEVARPLKLQAIRDQFDILRKIAAEGVFDGSLTPYEASEILYAAQFYDDISDELEGE